MYKITHSRFIHTDRNRKFSLIFVAARCQQQTEYPNKPSESDFDLAFAQCEWTLS